ncbi:MAG: response regulator [Desulfobacterales bacterium]|jgi:DNA-binding NtrC family response regulator
MADINILEGKKVLIVDDEPDILEALEETLDMCEVDTSTEFEAAKKLLTSKSYDIVVLDIMGVDGYELLAVTQKNGIPTVMLTAHALSADNFAKSMDGGACAYLPKDKLFEIDVFLSDVLEDRCASRGVLGKWFGRLKGYYESKFGPGWLDEYKQSWH